MLLREAALDRSGTIMRLNMLNGLTLQSNGKTFGSEKRDPRVEASLEAAMSELENEGLLQAASYKREIFKVTARGYEVADTLMNRSGT